MSELPILFPGIRPGDKLRCVDPVGDFTPGNIYTVELHLGKLALRDNQGRPLYAFLSEFELYQSNHFWAHDQEKPIRLPEDRELRVYYYNPANDVDDVLPEDLDDKVLGFFLFSPPEPTKFHHNHGEYTVTGYRNERGLMDRTKPLTIEWNEPHEL